jgi:hypothetical protein
MRWVWHIELSDFAAAARQIAIKRLSQLCVCPSGVGARLPAICREPAVKPAHAEYLAQRVA